MRMNNDISRQRNMRQRTHRFEIRPGDTLLLSFLIPFVLMFVICAGKGIFPFGDQTFLRTDMYHQYAPFFSEFQYKLQHGGSLLHSWDIGLGVNFSALYAYYLASPMNWFILLVPKRFILEFMTFLIILKVGLCGLSSAFYLRRHFHFYGPEVLCFSLFYAMSGYISAYSWNIMWLDCIALFPVIIYGLEELYSGRGGMIYAVSLGLSILSNYYISIMTCIFLVIYFLLLPLLRSGAKEENFFDRAAHFLFFSLLAGGMAAVTLIPEIFALQGTASGNFGFKRTVTEYFSIIDMFARHMINVTTEQGLDHWPNLYCGSFVFLLLPMFFLNRGIPLKKKAVGAGLLLFFYLSFSINLLDYIWHGLHFPNSLPCRQSYIYVGLILVLCFEAYRERRRTDEHGLMICLSIGIGMLLLFQKVVSSDQIPWHSIYLTMLFLVLYAAFILLERRAVIRHQLLLILVLTVLSAEALVNMAVTSVFTVSRTVYKDDNEDVEKLVSEVREEDPSFYRFEKVTRKTKDDGAWMNFPSVSLFSSTAYKECSDFFRLIGCESSVNAYSITGSTPLVNMLFNVKYQIYSEQPAATGERGLNFVKESGNTSIYRTDFSLPVGFLLSDSINTAWDASIGTPALVQNSLCEAAGTDPVLVSALGEFSGGDYTFTTPSAGEYYVYVENKSIQKVRVTEGTLGEKTFENVDRGYFLELGYLPEGQHVTVSSLTSGQDMNCDAYCFDYNALRELYTVLNRQSLEVTDYTDTRIDGNIETTERGVLMTSIPYDAGWSIMVDGEKAEKVVVKDTFLGVRLEPGIHTIRLTYFPEGLSAGAAASFVSVLLLIFSGQIFRPAVPKRKRHPKPRSRELSEKIQNMPPQNPISSVRKPERHPELDPTPPTERVQSIDAIRKLEKTAAYPEQEAEEDRDRPDQD